MTRNSWSDGVESVPAARRRSKTPIARAINRNAASPEVALRARPTCEPNHSGDNQRRDDVTDTRLKGGACGFAARPSALAGTWRVIGTQ
jgi:hypothetical protein